MPAVHGIRTANIQSAIGTMSSQAPTTFDASLASINSYLNAFLISYYAPRATMAFLSILFVLSLFSSSVFSALVAPRDQTCDDGTVVSDTKVRRIPRITLRHLAHFHSAVSGIVYTTSLDMACKYLFLQASLMFLSFPRFNSVCGMC